MMIGETISHYKIIQKLGEGGMGVVYKAEDLRLLRPVAIKFLSPELSQIDQALKLFRHEAIAASATSHPNICTIYEIDSAQSQQFIVMEFIAGKTLRQILQDSCPLLEDRVIDILCQICSALIAAHDVGIIHRDIKPANIMICSKTGYVKIMDFGLAKLASDTTELLLRTKSQVQFRPVDAFSQSLINSYTSVYSGMVGTVGYMSPEQIEGQSLNHQCDIFSLGIVAYELLCGERPFVGKSKLQILEKIVLDPHVPILEKKSHLDPRWISIIDKALQKDRECRFKTAKDFADEITKIQQQKAIETSQIAHRKRPEKKAIVKVWSAILMIGLLFVIALFYLAKSDIISSEEQDSKVTVSGMKDIADFDVTTQSAEAFRHFTNGQKAWWRYDISKAIDELQMAVDLDSTFAYANVLLGVLLNWRDRMDEFAVCIKRVEMSLDSVSDWEKLLVLGFIAYGRNQVHEMADYYNELIRTNPVKIDGYLLGALAYERMDSLDRAIDLTKGAIEIDPCHIAAHGNLADLYCANGELEEAEHYAQEELRLIKSSGDLTAIDGAYDILGQIEHFMGKRKSAISNFEKSIKISPQNHNAYYYLAEAYALDGEVARAEKILRRALLLPQLHSERAAIYGMLARLMALQGRRVEALSHLNKAQSLFIESQDYSSLVYNLYEISTLHLEMGNLDLAEIEWQSSIAKIAEFYKTTLRYKKYDKRFALDCFLFREAREMAEQKLDDIRRLFGGNSITYHKYSAEFYFKFQEYDKAFSTYRDIWKNCDQTDHFRIFWHYKMVKIYEIRKQYDQALKLCHQCPKTPRIFSLVPISIAYSNYLALLSTIHESLGNEDEAIKYCKMGLSYWERADPGFPLVHEVTERMNRLLQQSAAE